jgi:hypothetical protein
MRMDQQVHSRYGLLIDAFVEIWVHTPIEPLGLDWEYFSLNPTVSCELKSIGDGSYEPIVVVRIFIILIISFKRVYQSCPGFHEVAVANTEWNGLPAYSTGDLLLQHPQRPNYYKVLGRSKDQVMLSSGEIVGASGNIVHLPY